MRQFEKDMGHGMKLVESIETNTKHYVEIVSRAVDNLLPPPNVEITYANPLRSPLSLTLHPQDIPLHS